METTKHFLDGVAPIKPEPYPFSELQTDWIKALRSGKYKQGMGFLRDSQDGYCCLGILCDLAGYPSTLEGKSYQYRDAVSGHAHASYLPYSAVLLANLHNSIGLFTKPVKFANVAYGPEANDAFGVNGDLHRAANNFYKNGHTSLGSMNDARVISIENGKFRAFTFNEIADYIEFDPWNVFTEPGELNEI